jgi:choline dehydrogenase-like flavoprotein
VSHRYTRRDLERRTLLVRRAKRILRRAGAWSFYAHGLKTFSHALGTVRMGVDEQTSPLDGDCRFRGLRNLLVVDGSALPTAAAVTPGLTIAANALRAADRLVKEDGR